MTAKPPSHKLLACISASLGGRLCGRSVLVRCYNNLYQMFEDRGMAISDVCASTDQLLRRIDATEPVLRGVLTDDKTDDRTAEGNMKKTKTMTTTTLVYVDVEERTGVKFLRALREEHPDDHVLIVNVDGPTPFTRKEMDEAVVEFWQVRELIINPTRHHLVPKHTGLDAARAQELRARRCMLYHQFPVLMATDIIARWHRYPKGTIVEIQRRGLAHEEGLYYRKVA